VPADIMLRFAIYKVSAARPGALSSFLFPSRNRARACACPCTRIRDNARGAAHRRALGRARVRDSRKPVVRLQRLGILFFCVILRLAYIGFVTYGDCPHPNNFIPSPLMGYW
jgi:hypothetical protein